MRRHRPSRCRRLSHPAAVLGSIGAEAYCRTQREPLTSCPGPIQAVSAAVPFVFARTRLECLGYWRTRHVERAGQLLWTGLPEWRMLRRHAQRFRAAQFGGCVCRAHTWRVDVAELW